MMETNIADPLLAQRQRRAIRVAGIVLACSTPISGFISWALVAILFGESRLEGPTSLPGVGLAAFGLPLLLGASLVLWSVRSPWLPGRRTMAALCAVTAAMLLGVGLWSAVASGTAGDASIGGGLLVLASIPTGIVAIVIGTSQRASE